MGSRPLQSADAAAAAKSLQSCLTLCDPIGSSPPGSTVPGILQARTLEWVAISFSHCSLIEQITHEPAGAAQKVGSVPVEGTECILGVLGAGGSHWPRDRSFMEQVQPGLCLNASELPWPRAQEGRGVAEEWTQAWGQ